MNPQFRFDLANSYIIFLSDEGKAVCSFNDVLHQIAQLADSLSVLDDIIDHATKRIVKPKTDQQFQKAIQTYENEGFKSTFCSFLFSSIRQYVVSETKNCCDAVRLFHTYQEYISENTIPRFDELKTALKTFVNLDPVFFPNHLPSSHNLHIETLGGDTYYSSELSCSLFLIMFRDLIISMGMTICTCTNCGKIFIGSPNAICCGDSECEYHLKIESPKQKREDLTKIAKNFSIYVRQYRYKVKKSGSLEAVQEFNEFTEPIQNYIVEKVKELRSNNAPEKMIDELKMEVDQKYAEINVKVKEILMRYGS